MTGEANSGSGGGSTFYPCTSIPEKLEVTFRSLSAIERAVIAERERCAKIVESYANGDLEEDCKTIAAEIRVSE